MDLKELERYGYKIYLEDDNLKVIGKKGKETRKQNNKSFAFYDDFGKRFYLTKTKIIKLLNGESVDKKYIKYYKREKYYICSICNLDYPFNEMRGNICYICKEDKKNDKPVRNIINNLRK
jgi:hypothetical protein